MYGGLIGNNGGRRRSSIRARLACVSDNLVSASRLSLFRTQGRVRTCSMQIRHVFSFIHRLCRRASRGRFIGQFSHVRGCRGVSSHVRIRVTACLTGITSNHLSSSDGRHLRIHLHIVSRVRDVTSSYCGLTRAVGHHHRRGRRFGRILSSGIRLVFGLISSTLRLVISLLGGSGFASSSITGSLGIRGRVGGFHGRLGGRGIVSIGRTGCACPITILCVSVISRYRGLNSCIIGIIRTRTSIERRGLACSGWNEFYCCIRSGF